MEIWDLYDKDKNLTGKTHERETEIPDGFFHLVVHAWIRNDKGQYLITQRAANRKHFPLMFECVGGSVLAGETSEEGAVREVVEEVGLVFKIGEGKLVHSEVREYFQGEKFSDILDVWVFDYTGDVDLTKATTDEVCYAEWVNVEQIKKLENDGKLIPTMTYIYELDKKLQNCNKNIKKDAKNKKKVKKLSERSKYFDFYDDVKAGCHKIIDW